MKKIILIFLLGLQMFTFSVMKTGVKSYDELDHNKGEVLFYYNDRDQKVSKAKATYYRKLFTVENNLSLIVDYEKTGNVFMIARVKNPNEVDIWESAEAEGKAFYFNENGNILMSLTFKNGLSNGERIFYYEDGNIMVKLNFKNGLREGQQFGYYENGQLAGQWSYSKGIETGKEKAYYKSGEIMADSLMKDSEMVSGKIYYKNGKILMEQTSITNKKIYDKNGNVLLYFENEQMFAADKKLVSDKEFKKKYESQILKLMEETILNEEFYSIALIVEGENLE